MPNAQYPPRSVEARRLAQLKTRRQSAVATTTLRLRTKQLFLQGLAGKSLAVQKHNNERCLDFARHDNRR
jgi:hypothetical protein